MCVWASLFVLLFLCSGGNLRLTGAFLHRHQGWIHHGSALGASSRSLYDPQRQSYLLHMVERKKVEVDELLRRHQAPDDPLLMRMTYMNVHAGYNLTRAIKREYFGPEELVQMSVMVDVKRRSPTVTHQREIVAFDSAAKFCELLAAVKVDAFFVNTDAMEYGGASDDLQACSKAMKTLRLEKPPPCVQKDIIIHPVQIALALEQGAAGVLVNAGVVGKDLETLLDAGTIMGTEVMVEVHTPNELDYALSKGATIFLLNMWDRFTGRLFSQQAKQMASMLPINSCVAVSGNIHTMEQVAELGYHGYDCVVIGRGITEIPDIRQFVSDVHDFKGPPRVFGMGMKSTRWAYEHGPGGPLNLS